MMSFAKSIGTHSGCFQADEALGVWMLRRLERFGGPHASVVRSRDPRVLAPLPIVIDVGGEYDHEKLRYDHHQRGFFETFDGKVGVATGPENATGKFKTKLSAAGLIYKHYGREVISALQPSLQEPLLNWVYLKMYNDFMEALDGNDNGIEVGDNKRYSDSTTLPMRVARLNSRWNEAEGGPSEDERFEKASELCGKEFSDALEYIVVCELPARKVVEEGEVIVFPSSGCPWKSHLYELEREHGVAPLVKFVLYQDTSGMWRVQAVTAEGTAFTNRLSLLEQWRGIRDEALCEVSGIEGCRFVHAAGFIGGNSTFEGALAMALKTLEVDKEANKRAKTSQ